MQIHTSLTLVRVSSKQEGNSALPWKVITNRVVFKIFDLHSFKKADLSNKLRQASSLELFHVRIGLQLSYIQYFLVCVAVL